MFDYSENTPFVSNTLIKIFKGSSIFIMAGYLTSAAGFFIRIILARNLTLKEFGLFYAAFSFLSLIGLLKNMGFNRALVKFIPEYLADNNYTAVRQAILLALGFSLLTSAVVIMCTLLFLDKLTIHYFHIPMAAKVMPIMLIYFLISTLSTVIASVFYGFKRPFYMTLKQFSGNAIILVSIIVIWEIDIIRLCWLHVGAAAVVLFGCIFGLFKIINIFRFTGWFSKKIFRQMAGFALPSTSTTIAAKTMGRMDNIMLTYFQTVIDVGFYSVAAPFARLFISLGSGIGKMMFPYSSELIYQKKGEELKEVIDQIHRHLFFSMMPLAIFLILGTSYLLPLIFGDKFADGIPAAQILIFGGVIHAISLINMNIINGLGFPMKVTKIVVISGLVNTIGNLILIPIISFIGAALATTISYGVGIFLSSHYLKQTVQFSVGWKNFSRILLAGVIVFVFNKILLFRFPVNNLPMLLFFFIFSMICYLAVSLFLRISNIKEMRHMINKLLINLLKD